MNENKYTVSETTATKVTVTISRRQLWKNYVETWADMSWDSVAHLSNLKDVIETLIPSAGSLQSLAPKIRKLFRDGNTVFLLASAMARPSTIDNNNMLREVIVTDTDGDRVEMLVIPHEDINF